MAERFDNKTYGASIAIDIAKDFNAVLTETRDGKRQHFRIANSSQDYDRLISHLRDLPAHSIVGFEATGNYPSCLRVSIGGGATRLAYQVCTQDHLFVLNGDTFIDFDVELLEKQRQRN